MESATKQRNENRVETLVKHNNPNTHINQKSLQNARRWLTVSSGRDHVAMSVTAGVYLFEREVRNAFPVIFLCMLWWECVCVSVVGGSWAQTYIFGIRADWGVLKSDIFCAFLFFYTEKKLFQKFLKKNEKRERLKSSAWCECWTKASLGGMSLHGREDTGLYGKKKKREKSKVKKNERADLLGLFALLAMTGLYSF